MKHLRNVESRKFPGHDYYVGYSKGVWHIRKAPFTYQGHGWEATKVDTGERFYRPRLYLISEELTKREKE